MIIIDYDISRGEITEVSMPIDFVITWVDGNDKEWQKKKQEALGVVNQRKTDSRPRRYRDWNNLVYLFRGIANYAPWVNHVFIVTPGQCPSWINIDNPKISIINQDDLFDDKTVLPTFNNCAVELLLHKIPGLSEQFVYLNDDMFFLKKTMPKDFFKNGLPCVTAAFCPALAEYSEDGKGVYGIVTMNTRIVAKHFKKKDIIKYNWKKYFDPRNGREIIKTICCLPFSALTSFNDMHTAYSFLKSTFIEVWEAEGEELNESCKERFRGEFSLCHYAMRYWQMAKGTFAVRRRSFSRFFDIHKKGDEKPVIKSILKGTPNMVCINDNIDDDEEFDEIVSEINEAFKKKFPQKCEFEK